MTRLTRNGKSQAKALKIICDDDVLESDLQWLVDFLDGTITDGKEYRVSEIIQVGFSILSIRDAGDFLVLDEPDMVSNTIGFVPGVTRTLKMLRMQKDVCASCGLEDSMNLPSLRQSAIICTGLSGSDFVLERAIGESSDSGWFCGCATGHDHNAPQNLRRVSLYQLAVALPACVPFLGLPSGVRVVQRSTKISILINGKEIQPIKGTFLGDFGLGQRA